MSSTISIADTFVRALTPSTNGVVGIVHQVLEFCQESGIEVDFKNDACRLRCAERGSEEVVPNALSKSAFRAVIARFAALCNEQTPNSVSPYGGSGQISLGNDPTSVFRVEFENTPDRQSLELKPLKPR
jgi:hypothetical protein